MGKRLRVWWIPQVPGERFTVEVESVAEGVKLLDVLVDYDEFQFEHKIKPDYCNVGGLEQWEDNGDGEGNSDWYSWYDEETGEEDPREWLSRVKPELDDVLTSWKRLLQISEGKL